MAVACVLAAHADAEAKQIAATPKMKLLVRRRGDTRVTAGDEIYLREVIVK